MKNLISTRVAIILFSLIIGFFGANHFLHGRAMAAVVPSYLPAHLALVYISGAGFLLAAIAFIIDRYAKLAGYLLALLLLLIIFMIDVPSIIHSRGLPIKMMYVTNMLKDAALAMAAVIIADVSAEKPIKTFRI